MMAAAMTLGMSATLVFVNLQQEQNRKRCKEEAVRKGHGS